MFEVYRDASPVLAQSSQTREQVLVVTLIASAVLAVFLYFVFRSADRRLKRQTRALMEATRRDALTGMLNHGAVVEGLTRVLDQALPTEQKVAIALVDVDNLGLLNDAHGHAAGDAILTEVATILHEEAHPATVIGRYGPDEFLLVAPPGSVHDLAPAIDRLRYRLREFAPRFGESEKLPVSVSVGLCEFPKNGRSVTELLSTVAVALSQAKISGGDRVRWAEATQNSEAHAEKASFDVLEGLVIAIDTKDQYTRRHSEDVARYAIFLAKRMGLPDDFLRTLHMAGMLHDIGKIGIPDGILRKPAPLTADEYNIVKQHVALGHMIVRDLPNLDLVRSGIRFHHEQWNGRGYLERMEGEQIPLVARILAVADAMSAMTTSRRYRKALPVGEALRRLEDAAGSQLDPELVPPFVRGMETVRRRADPRRRAADHRPLDAGATHSASVGAAARAAGTGWFQAAPRPRAARATGHAGGANSLVADERRRLDDPTARFQTGGHAAKLSRDQRARTAANERRGQLSRSASLVRPGRGGARPATRSRARRRRHAASRSARHPWPRRFRSSGRYAPRACPTPRRRCTSSDVAPRPAGPPRAAADPGAGFACFTWLPSVTRGCDGSPSASIIGRACSARLDVAIDQGQRAASSASSSAVAPGWRRG